MITVKSTEKPTLKLAIENLRRTACRTVLKRANGPEYFRQICNHIAPLVGLEPHEFWTLVDEKTRIREVIDIKHIAWTVIRSVKYGNSPYSYYRQYPFIKLAQITGNDHSTVICGVHKTFDMIKRNKEFARVYYQGLQKMVELCTA